MSVQKWLVDPALHEATHANAHLMICAIPALARTTCYVLDGPSFDLKQVKDVSDILVAKGIEMHGAAAQALYKLT